MTKQAFWTLTTLWVGALAAAWFAPHPWGIALDTFALGMCVAETIICGFQIRAHRRARTQAQLDPA